MILKINKKELLENSGFMLGVNKGFNDSPLPKFAVRSYSDLNKLKKEHAENDGPIAQDLGLRVGTQLAVKGAIGGTVYGAAKHLQNVAHDNGLNIDPNSDSSDFIAAIPAIASAWYLSDKANNYMPEVHKKLVGADKSIYK